MKTKYKIPIIVACVLASWILFPNIPGTVCHFAYSDEAINEDMDKSEFCSITGINFFGNSIDTNFFREEVRHRIFADCYYENDGEIKIC